MSLTSFTPLLIPAALGAARGVGSLIGSGLSALQGTVAPQPAKASTANSDVGPFRQFVLQELRRAGVAVEGAFQLSANAAGQLQVEAGEQSSRLAAFLNSRPNLVSQFQRLARERGPDFSLKISAEESTPRLDESV